MAGGLFLREGILKFAYGNQGVGRFTDLGTPLPSVYRRPGCVPRKRRRVALVFGCLTRWFSISFIAMIRGVCFHQDIAFILAPGHCRGCRRRLRGECGPFCTRSAPDIPGARGCFASDQWPRQMAAGRAVRQGRKNQAPRLSEPSIGNKCPTPKPTHFPSQKQRATGRSLVNLGRLLSKEFSARAHFFRRSGYILEAVGERVRDLVLHYAFVFRPQKLSQPFGIHDVLAAHVGKGLGRNR